MTFGRGFSGCLLIVCAFGWFIAFGGAACYGAINPNDPVIASDALPTAIWLSLLIGIVGACAFVAAAVAVATGGKRDDGGPSPS